MIMNELEYFKNFNLGREIDLAGSFAYNALSFINSSHDVYMNDQIFMFLYNASVAVERMQKCVLFIFGEYNKDNFAEFAITLKSHDHQKLQSCIFKYTHKKLSEEQNSLIILMRDFYSEGRYSNYSMDSTYNYENALETYVKANYGKSMVVPDFLGTGNVIVE